MKKVHSLLILFLLLPIVWVYPQASIKLNLLTDLNSLDLGSMFFANDLKGQTRIFQVAIEPLGKEVFIQGEVYWKQNLNSSFDKVFSFTTNIFSARSFFNDELGNSEVSVDKNESNKTLVDELVKRGKLTGVVRFILRLYDSKSSFLDDDQDEITFLNPSAPRILLSANQVFPIGNIIINWDEDPSAKDYIVLANDQTSAGQSDEAVLSSGNPLINNVAVGPISNINLNDLQKRREFLPGDVIVVQVKKLVYDSGFPKYLKSLPVRFSIEQPIETGGQTIDLGGQPLNQPVLSRSSTNLVSQTPNIDLIRLSTLLNGKIDQAFLDKLTSGEIQPNQIQIFDKEGKQIMFSDFVRLLSLLEANPISITTIYFTPKQ